jgi:hypothetical protein
MKIALAYGDKFSVDAEYSYDDGYELVEQNGKIVQHDYHVIIIEKVTISFIGLPEADITKLLTDEHIRVLESQIHDEIELQNNFGD